MIRTWKWEVFALALLVVGASSAAAQQYPRDSRDFTRPRAQPVQPASQPRTTQRYYSATPEQSSRQRGVNADQKIATWLINCNQAEIKMGKYAARHAENSDVREFADQLVQDHQWLFEKLQRFAPRAASMSESSSGRDFRDDESGEPRQTRSTRAWDDAVVSHQISDRIAKKVRDELSEKEGIEFDRCFVGQQLVAHQQDQAKLEVLRQYASSELRDVIDEAVEVVEGHEQQARDLMKDLKRDEQSSSRGDSERRSSEENYNRQARRDRDRDSRSYDRESEQDRSSERDSYRD